MLEIRFPLILVNFKTYIEATGRKALVLAKTIEEVSLETGVCMAVAPQFTDISTVSREVGVPVFAQHIDPIVAGSHTGHVLVEAVKEAGAVGTLINHSEKQLVASDVFLGIKRAHEVGLTTCVCSSSAQVSAALAALEPDILAIEPPELIGSGVAVSKAQPEVVTEAIRLVRGVNRGVAILCGAGITDAEDVAAALRLGAKGVLVASGVVKARDPRRVLLEFAEACTQSG